MCCGLLPVQPAAAQPPSQSPPSFLVRLEIAVAAIVPFFYPCRPFFSTRHPTADAPESRELPPVSPLRSSPEMLYFILLKTPCSRVRETLL